MNADLVTRLSAGLGNELAARIVADPAVIRARRYDYWVVSHLRNWRNEPQDEPGCVVQPTSTAEVAHVVQWAAANGVSLMPFGLGSGVVGGILPTPDTLLVDLSQMNATRSIDKHNLLATFEAGKNGLEAEEEVAELGLTIGHWPQSIAVSSVGGWISTRASGQFSTAYGNIEDIVYSIEAVLPSGEIVTLGKAPRASAGPDLRHILMGAEGTMGIVTAVTLSLRRAPQARRCTAFHVADLAQGFEAQRQIMADDWRPPVMRQYDAIETKRSFREFRRIDVAGQPIDEGMLIMVHEGPTDRVQAEVDDVSRIALEAGLVTAHEGATEQWLDRRNHVPEWTEHFEKGYIVDTVEVSATWSQIEAVYRDAIAGLRRVDGVVNASAHSSHAYRSGINLYFTFAAAGPSDQLEGLYFECWRQVMEATAANGGGIAHHHGAGRLRKPYLVHDLGASGIGLLRAVKQAVDPAGIMNPGNLIPDQLVQPSQRGGTS